MLTQKRKTGSRGRELVLVTMYYVKKPGGRKIKNYSVKSLYLEEQGGFGEPRNESWVKREIQWIVRKHFDSIQYTPIFVWKAKHLNPIHSYNTGR